MAHIAADRVQETTTTTGSGVLTLAGAVTNFKTFASRMATSDTCWYAIVDSTNSAWEVGLGTLASSTTLDRTAVTASSNSDAAVSFAAGTKNVFITQGAGTSISMDSIATPAVPPPGGIVVFSKDVGGRNMPAYIGASGLDSALQPILGRNKLAWAQAVGNATTMSLMGIAVTAVGTATTANVVAAADLTGQRRVNYLVTVAATTAVAGWRDSTAKYFMGTGGYGGFHFIHRFGIATGVASDSTRRIFVGFTSSVSAATDVNPSTIANCLGVGADTADTNFFFMWRTGTGTVVRTNTGIPKSASDNTEGYELAMFTAPGSGVVKFEFTRFSDGAVATTTASSSVPAATTLLAPRGAVSVGGTSSVIGFSFISITIETDQ